MNFWPSFVVGALAIPLLLGPMLLAVFLMMQFVGKPQLPGFAAGCAASGVILVTALLAYFEGLKP